MKLSIVVPCYNEEENVFLFYEEVKKIFKKENFEYEVIFVNDGSKDKTYQNLKKIAKESRMNIKVINFSRNFGKEAGIYAGLQEAKGEYISLIDADMQQDPSLILEMVDFLEKESDYDSVCMYQEERKEGRVLTFFKRSFYKLINKVSDTKFVNGASDFRTFRKEMKDAILSMTEYFRFSKGIFSFVGFNTYYKPYIVKERATGTSKWSFWKLFSYAIDGIVAFTTAPLKLATMIGLLSSFISIVYLIIVVIQKLCYGIAVPGYATIVVLILLLGGLQLFALGIIGEYLARCYVEVKKRPIYIVKNKIESKKKVNE